MRWMDRFARGRQTRTVLRLEAGGADSPEDPFASWFGRVSAARPGEEWPTKFVGKRMAPICQLNLAALPWPPRLLADIAFLSLYVEDPMRDPDADAWCVRTYRRLDELVPIPPQVLSAQDGPVRPLPLRPVELPLQDQADSPVRGVKLGGYPRVLQDPLGWSREHVAHFMPEYVMQIDFVDASSWRWSEESIAYLGRGTAPGFEDEWLFEWQQMD